MRSAEGKARAAEKDDFVTRLVDKAVGLVSPRRAVVRKHFRLMERDEEYRDLAFAALRARGYRAATDSKSKTPWGGASTSADAEVVPASGRLSDKARELDRDDPIGSGIMGTFAREIIGTELRPRCGAKDKKVVDAGEAVWYGRKSELTPSDPGPLGQWQRTFARTVLRDGGAIVKRAITKAGEPVWFETIERERVRTPSDAKPRDPDGRIVDGVEKDRYGRYVAYWILKKHPNDVPPNSVGVLTNPTSFSSKDFVRTPIDALRDVKLVDRAGQTKGISDFHSVTQDIRDLDLFMLASLKRLQISACFAAFIQSTNEAPDLLPVTAANYGYQLEQALVPGMIFKLYPGETVEQISPNFPVPEVAEFVILLARRIGAALGVSWQTILRDWSDSSYSGARATLLADRVTFMILRHLVREGAFDWMWSTVMEDAVMRGDERLKGVTNLEELVKVQWLGDGQAWVDPLKEAQATQLKLLMGIVTLRDVCEEAGGNDWEEQLRQRLVEEKREIEIRAELGLPPKAAPAPITINNGPDAPGDQGDDGEAAAPPKKKQRSALGLRPRRRVAA